MVARTTDLSLEFEFQNSPYLSDTSMQKQRNMYAKQQAIIRERLQFFITLNAFGNPSSVKLDIAHMHD